MKNLIILVLMCSVCTLTGQEKETLIKKELRFKTESNNNLLVIENIFGNIEVIGYEGNTIQIEVQKKVSAKSQKALEKGLEEVDLAITEKEDFKVLYMKSPCSVEPPADLSREDLDENWNFQCDNYCNWKPSYEFQFDYKVKVPSKLNIQVATINDGEVSISKVFGRIRANNINGGITLNDIAGPTFASTINGDVNIIYRNNPNDESRYYTLNGDINALYQKGLSADLFFKSQYGDFFTDIQPISKIPMIVKKEKVSGQKGITYKIGGESGIKIREGGTKLEFETFNGDVFVKEN